MTWYNVHITPIISSFLLIFAFVISYVISLLRNDVDHDLPYISDIGTISIESCIFSQLINISCVFLIFTLYLRYKQLEQYHRDNLSVDSVLNQRNLYSFIFGLISIFGLSIVANFQEPTLYLAHIIGAITYFVSGIIYCILQTQISFKLGIYRRLLIFRLFIVIAMLIFFLNALGFRIYLTLMAKELSPKKWKPSDSGYEYHLISAISEWVCAFCFDIYILTFAFEMKKMIVSAPKVLFIIENISNPNFIYNSIEVYPNAIPVETSNNVRSSLPSTSQQQNNAPLIH